MNNQKNTSTFFKQIPGSTSVRTDVDSIIGSNGDLKELVGIDALIRSIYVALTTIKGTYPYNPEYGMGIYLYVFELGDSRTQSILEREVIRTIAEQEPKAKANVVVNFFTDKTGFLLDINVKLGNEERNLKVVIDDTIIRSGIER